MTAVNRILVIIDPTAEDQPALTRAAWLAERLEARLELFICAYDQYVAGTRFFNSSAVQAMQDQLIEDYVDALNTLAEGPKQRGLDVRVDARWEHPLNEGVLRKIYDTDPTLVVKDTHYHSAIKRSIFSSTDWNLMRDCPTPLLLVKPRKLTETPTVIAAVDPVHRHEKTAELDHTIIAASEKLTKAVNGNLQIFHSFDPAPSISAAARQIPPQDIDVKQITATIKRQHEEAMAQLTADYSIPADRIQLHQGPPQHTLTAVATQENADFVVIGTASRSASGRNYLGGTAERVLDHIPCDLLLLKPPGFERLEI